MKQTAIASPAKGFIDALDAGRIRGWMFNPQATNDCKRFYIALQDHVITTGRADQYRQDLEQAGIGDGYCSFSLPCGLPLSSLVGKTLTLLDDQERPITGAKLTVEAPVNRVEFILLSLSATKLTFSYKSDIAQTTHLLLSANDIPVTSLEAELDKGTGQVTVPLPVDFERDREVAFHLAVSGFPCVIWQQRLYIAPLCASNQLLSTDDCVGESDQPELRAKALASSLVSRMKNASLVSVQSALNAFAASQGQQNLALALPKVTVPEFAIILPLGLNKAELYQFLGAYLLCCDDMPWQLIWVSDSDEAVDIPNLKIIKVAQECTPAAALQLAVQAVIAPVTVICPFAVDFNKQCISLITSQLAEAHIGFVGTCLEDYAGYLIDSGIVVDRPLSGKGEPLAISSNSVELELAAHCKHRYLRPIDFCLMAPSAYHTAELRYLSVPQNANNVTDLLIAWQDQLNSKQLAGIYHPRAFVRTSMTSAQRQILKEAVSLTLNQATHHRALPPLCFNGQARLGTIAMIDARIPTLDKDAGSYAAIQEMKLLQALGYHVVFIPLNMTSESSYTQALQDMGIEVCYAPYYSSFAQALESQLTTVAAVYITRHNVASQCLDYIQTQAPGVPVLFNNADLHFLREIRSALSMDTESPAAKQQQQQLLKAALDTKNSELDVMQRADAVLSYNEAEHAVITSHLLVQDKIFKCPWVLEAKTQQCQFEQSDGIAFLGGYKHWPNVEAVEYFLNTVFPALVERAPYITCNIYGSHMPDAFQRFKHPNIKLVGYVKNLDDVFLHHRIFIAPLQSGAGIKGKVLESAAYGTPSVLSPVAAESTGLIDKLNTLIANTPDAWVDNIVALYNDQSLWTQLSHNAHALATEQYSFQHGLEAMAAALNFIGLKTTSS